MGNPNGLTQAEATHGKPKRAQRRQRRLMGNPNGPTEAEATHRKPNGLTETEAKHGEPKWASRGTGDTWETQMG